MLDDFDSSQLGPQPNELRQTLKNKVLLIQHCYEKYYKLNDSINYAFTHPNEVEITKIEQMIKEEEDQLRKINKIYDNLSIRDRRPYTKLIELLQQKVIEHRDLLRVIDEEDQFIEKMKRSSQMDQKQFQKYLERLSLPYRILGLMALLGGFLLHLIAGASFRWNMINTYISSYYKVTTQPYLIVAQDSFAAPLSLFFMGIGMRLGLRIGQAIGSLYTCIIAAIFSALSVYLSSYMPYLQWYAIFACVLYPIFVCLSFQLAISECCNYYGKYRMAITGFLLVGLGMGHVFFGMLNTNCFNPQDIAPQNGFYGGDLDFIARRVPQCMRQNGYATLICGVIGIALLYPAIAYNTRKKSQAKQRRVKIDDSNVCASEKEALTSGIFWLIIAMAICSTSGNYFMITNFRNLCAHFDKDSMDLAGIMLGFNVANALSRAFWDFLFSKMGFKWCLVIITSINAFVLGTIEFVVKEEGLYRLYFLLGGICLGGCMVSFFNILSLVFGQKVSQQLPGYIWTAYSLASWLQYGVFNSYDLTKYGFGPSCIVLCVLNLVSLSLVVRFKLLGEWQNSLRLLELRCCYE